MNEQRRRGLRHLATLCAALAVPAVRAAAPEVEVWKSPTCGCCGKWVNHMKANGFSVTTNDVGNLAGWRARHGMPSKYGSCHTARVGGYTLEGHVPAADVQRLLRERPDAIGLAVPNMPIGSPGMEIEGRRDAYDVLLVLRDGSAKSFSHYPALRGPGGI
jgi:hypothetical protein